MNNTCNRDAEKNLFVAGSDPHYWREYHAKIPSGFGGRSGPVPSDTYSCARSF